ncbi:MAG: hypothetical protein HYV07_22775 [Deltaproteobacteria bacterium]|nr:hypothetical protein [Deltaproteobacteria bacterium]
MKPEGCSLDIAVVGLGQAGGNLATEFFRRGYRALALNTAQTDLSALDPGSVYPPLPAERRIYIGEDGYDGAGLDPDYAAECILRNADQIRNAVLRESDGADAVLLTAGLGGGTGSALNTLITVLREEDLPLVALMTLPTDGESGIVKVNAVRAINQLVDAQVLGWVFVDNQRIESQNRDVSVIDYYAHINGRIASPIDAFNRLNSRTDIRPIRSFDGEDLRKLFLSGGVICFNTTELDEISPTEVVGAVRAGLESSELMPTGFEIRSASYVGMVIEAPDSVLTRTPIATFESIDETLKRETGGAAIYRGIYRASQAKKALLRTLIAVHSLPHRIRELLADAQREGETLRTKLQVELPTLDLGGIQGIELFKPGARSRPSDRPRRSARRSNPAPAPTEGLDLEFRPRRAGSDAPEPRRVEPSGRGDPPIERPPTPVGRSSRPAEDRKPRPAATAGSEAHQVGRLSSDRVSLAERADRVSERSEKVPERLDRVSSEKERSEKPIERAERSERIPERPERERSDKPAERERPEKPAERERPEKPAERLERPLAPPPGDKIERAQSEANYGERSEPAGRSDGEASPRQTGGLADGDSPRPGAAKSAAPDEPRVRPSVSPRRPLAQGKKPARPAAARPGPLRGPRPAEDASDEETVMAVESSSLLVSHQSEAETGEINRDELDLRREMSKLGLVSDAFDEELPTPETYDRMVSDFLHSRDSSAREQIFRRLEEDSSAEQTVIRYYAVEAMAKLGREVFGGVLLRATEDENEAVRAIAVEALRR